jgi:glycosyltransferase involved in cell wall biosynthesis
MNICILGQGTGGNARLWFDFWNKHLGDFPEIEKFTLVCRNKLTLDASFNTVAAYGTNRMPPCFYRVYAPFVSRIGLSWIMRRVSRRNSPDIFHLQGNYNPSLNLKVMKVLKCPTVLNIYGSDFYQQYVGNKFSAVERVLFEKVVDQAAHIVFNWFTTQKDFLKYFPKYAEKCSSHPWGIDEKWRAISPPLKGWPKAERIFLSARGIYEYNNIDIVTEAFCKAFKDRPETKLFLVNGYGNHASAIRKVKAIVEKYGAQDQVIMRIGEWIPEEELMALYEKADYNICFGSTDQLTVSICYGFEKKAVNILSPLKNYYDLQEQGYRTLRVVEALSLEALENTFSRIQKPAEDDLVHDQALAREQFNMKTTFNSYLNIYKRILQRQ